MGKYDTDRVTDDAVGYANDNKNLYALTAATVAVPLKRLDGAAIYQESDNDITREEEDARIHHQRPQPFR